MKTFSTDARTFKIPDPWTGSVWTRLEGSIRAASLEPGLQARLADPLWLLHRQWQVGEFQGEDAASPVEVELHSSSSALSGYHPGADATGEIPAHRYPRQVPLEAVVERQRSLVGASAWGLAAEAGQHALRLLDAHGAAAHRGALRKDHRLGAPPPDDPMLQGADHHRIRVLRRTGVDGRRLARSMRGKSGADLARELGIPAADQPRVAAALDAWRAWYGSRITNSGRIDPSWTSSRMEHGFQISAQTAAGPVTLAADEYPGGHLDWWAFDVEPRATHHVEGKVPGPRRGKVRTLPTPLRYAGMPADRFWEREEGTVDFGGLQGGPSDLARLVVAEFATVYGDDWFLVPLAVDEGSLVRVTKLRVIDTFGRSETISSAARIDGPQRVFRMFELDGDEGPDHQDVAPWLFVAPSLAQVDQGRVVERVTFARDEGANVAWAIEQLVENLLGRPVKRREAWLEHAAALEAAAHNEGKGEAPTGARDQDWRYLLQSTVPPHWIPLVPTRIDGSKEVNLRRGVMQQWEDLPAQLGAGPRSALLEPGKVLRVREEEIPREGISVTRRWQLARNSDGRVFLWLGRRKRVGRGERASGLRFDRIERS